jgi:hypothetical protein
MPKTIEFHPDHWDAILGGDDAAKNPAVLLGMENEDGTQLLVHFTLSDFLRFAQEIADCADHAIKFRRGGLHDADVVLLGPDVVGR